MIIAIVTILIVTTYTAYTSIYIYIHTQTCVKMILAFTFPYIFSGESSVWGPMQIREPFPIKGISQCFYVTSHDEEVLRVLVRSYELKIHICQINGMKLKQIRLLETNFYIDHTFLLLFCFPHVFLASTKHGFNQTMGKKRQTNTFNTSTAEFEDCQVRGKQWCVFFRLAGMSSTDFL